MLVATKTSGSYQRQFLTLVRMVILLVRNLFVLSRYLHFKRSKSMSLKKPENFKRLIFQNFSNFRQTEYIFFEKKLGLAFQRVRICQTHCVEDIFSCRKSLSVDSRCLRTPGSNKKKFFWNLPRPDFEKIYILCFQLRFPLDPVTRTTKERSPKAKAACLPPKV